jgi:hypothetical protein
MNEGHTEHLEAALDGKYMIERPLSEIETTANLRHPHILTLFELVHALALLLVVLLFGTPSFASGQDRAVVEREIRVINGVLAAHPSTVRALAGVAAHVYFNQIGVGDGPDRVWVSCESDVCGPDPREEARLDDLVELEIQYVRGGFGETSYWSIQFRCSRDPLVGSNCTRPSALPFLSAHFADPNRDDLRFVIASVDRLWSEIAPGRPCNFWPQSARESVPCSAVSG